MPTKHTNDVTLPAHVIDALARAFLTAFQDSIDTSNHGKGDQSR